jgi:hypothetical protein
MGHGNNKSIIKFIKYTYKMNFQSLKTCFRIIVQFIITKFNKHDC